MEYELNADKTRAIMPINDFANICGYFYNAQCPNGGYNCKHPECAIVYNGIGCCYACGCPFGWAADEEDCAGFGWDYDEGALIIIDDMEMLQKLQEE